MRPFEASESQRVEGFGYGPLLDVFVLGRWCSYRGANGYNRQERPGPDTAFPGAPSSWPGCSAAWPSRAPWKVVAADMPLSLLVDDGKDAQGRNMFEAVANGDGPVLAASSSSRSCSRTQRQKVRNAFRLAHGGRAPRRAPLLRPEAGGVSRLRPLLGVRSRPAERRDLRPNPLDNTFAAGRARERRRRRGRPTCSPLGGMRPQGKNIDARGGLAVDLRDHGPIHPLPQGTRAGEGLTD